MASKTKKKPAPAGPGGLGPEVMDWPNGQAGELGPQRLQRGMRKMIKQMMREFPPEKLAQEGFGVTTDARLPVFFNALTDGVPEAARKRPAARQPRARLVPSTR